MNDNEGIGHWGRADAAGVRTGASDGGSRRPSRTRDSKWSNAQSTAGEEGVDALPPSKKRACSRTWEVPKETPPRRSRPPTPRKTPPRRDLLGTSKGTPPRRDLLLLEVSKGTPQRRRDLLGQAPKGTPQRRRDLPRQPPQGTPQRRRELLGQPPKGTPPRRDLLGTLKGTSSAPARSAAGASQTAPRDARRAGERDAAELVDLVDSSLGTGSHGKTSSYYGDDSQEEESEEEKSDDGSDASYKIDDDDGGASSDSDEESYCTDDDSGDEDDDSGDEDDAEKENRPKTTRRKRKSNGPFIVKYRSSDGPALKIYETKSQMTKRISDGGIGGEYRKLGDLVWAIDDNGFLWRNEQLHVARYDGSEVEIDEDLAAAVLQDISERFDKVKHTVYDDLSSRFEFLPEERPLLRLAGDAIERMEVTTPGGRTLNAIKCRCRSCTKAAVSNRELELFCRAHAAQFDAELRRLAREMARYQRRSVLPGFKGRLMNDDGSPVNVKDLVCHAQQPSGKDADVHIKDGCFVGHCSTINDLKNWQLVNGEMRLLSASELSEETLKNLGHGTKGKADKFSWATSFLMKMKSHMEVHNGQVIEAGTVWYILLFTQAMDEKDGGIGCWRQARIGNGGIGNGTECFVKTKANPKPCLVIKVEFGEDKEFEGAKMTVVRLRGETVSIDAEDPAWVISDKGTIAHPDHDNYW